MLSKRLSYLLATFLWLSCAFEIGLIMLRTFQGRLQDTPVFGNLLTAEQWADRLAPLAVIAVLGWVLLEIFLHAWRIRKEQGAVQQLKGVSLEGLRSKQPPAESRAGRRRQLVVVHASSPEQLREVLPAIAALDAASLENLYGLTKTYVWVLPVIGFIGTAWGMSHAIGGFSQALAETSDPKVLTDRLGQLVIPGLANAFSVTMLALGAAIVAHFCVSIVQSWETDVLNELDQISVELLAQLPRSLPSGQGDGLPPEFATLLMQMLQQVTEQLEEIREELDLSEATQRLVVTAEDLSTAAKAIEAAADELKASANAPYHVTITRGESR